MNKRFILICFIFSSTLLLSGFKSIMSIEPLMPKEDEYSIGMKAFGGVIFYIDKTNLHGLVVSVNNIGGSWMKYPWGCYGYSLSDAEGIDVGSGRINTNAILNSCSDKNSAAQACFDYEYEGYSDWFLPSLEELEMIAENLAYDDEFSDIINFDNDNYLSSTQLKNKKHQKNYAWSVNIKQRYSTPTNKSNKQKIRAVRAF